MTPPGVAALGSRGAWLQGTLLSAQWPFTGLGSLLAAKVFMLVLGPMEVFGCMTTLM